MREMPIATPLSNSNNNNNNNYDENILLLNEIQRHRLDGEIQSYSLVLSFFAGFATTIGGCIVVYLISRNNALNKNNRVRHEYLQKMILGISLSFAAGVMISVSLFDLYFPVLFKIGFYAPTGWLLVGMALFILLSKSLDYFLPSLEPAQTILPLLNENEEDRKLKALRSKNLRIGLLMFISLTLHNFPEGLSVSVASNSSKE